MTAFTRPQHGVRLLSDFTDMPRRAARLHREPALRSGFGEVQGRVDESGGVSSLERLRLNTTGRAARRAGRILCERYGAGSRSPDT